MTNTPDNEEHIEAEIASLNTQIETSKAIAALIVRQTALLKEAEAALKAEIDAQLDWSATGQRILHLLQSLPQPTTTNT